jgi:putative N6-adenine-specific DNA methylase
MKTPEKLFAVTAPGLERVCAGELAALGVAGVRTVPGGVEFEGDRRDLYRANLWLRTASRVVVRIGAVKGRDFPDLFRKAVRLPWGKYLRPGTRVVVRASSHGSRLNHTGRIADTIGDAVDRSLGRGGAPVSGPEQLILARFENDVCLLSLDSSGALLHRRGYREETALAPLRETLAAGILMLLGWNGSSALVDPMCGSGTFVIEGALIAGNRPPGMRRSFAFMDWPHYRPGLWEVLLTEAGKGMQPVSVPICGSDRDERVVASARRNADRAGVPASIDFQHLELSRRPAPEGRGILLCNPPYGERLGRNIDLRPLFRSLGTVFRERFGGWGMAIVSPDEDLAKATGLPLRKRAVLNNGGIQIFLFTSFPDSP